MGSEKMPRPSFSDNPLLRVSRPVSACSRCRSAKVKCDGKLPACTACEKAGRGSECSSANDQFARGKERSYVAALELRIEKVQRRLEYAKLRKASVAHHDPKMLPVNAERGRIDSLAKIEQVIHRNAARKRENSDVNTLVSDFGLLSVNAATRDFEPSSTNLTFARVVLAAATNDPLPSFHPSSAPDPAFPSRQAALATLRFYMDNIYILFPCFLETALLSIFENVYDHDDRHVQPAERSMLYLVLAVGSAAQSRQNGDDLYETAVNYVSRALAHADRALAPGYVIQIQCLILLTQYAMLDPAHFDSWHLIGFAARATVDLGFHQDLPPQSVPDKVSLDMRRKIFYSVYSLDRAISMVHARAFSFTDNAINVALPTASSSGHSHSRSPSSATPPPDPALLHFELRRLQSESYQELFQSDPAQPLTPDDLDGNQSAYTWRACGGLREWSKKLSADLTPDVRKLFDLELHYSYVYCVAPSTRAPRLNNHARVLVFEHALAYLEGMYAVANCAASNAFYTYHDVLKVYFMASQLVAVLREAEDALLSGARPSPAFMTTPSADGVSLVSRSSPLPSPRVGVPAETSLDRSVRCLEGVPQTLRRWGQRWADATSILGSFEDDVSEMVDRLNLRKSIEEVIIKREPREPDMGSMSPTSPLRSMTGVIPSHGPPPASPSHVQSSPRHGHGYGHQHQHSLSPTHPPHLHGLSPPYSLGPSHAMSPQSPLTPLSPQSFQMPMGQAMPDHGGQQIR